MTGRDPQSVIVQIPDAAVPVIVTYVGQQRRHVAALIPRGTVSADGDGGGDADAGSDGRTQCHVHG
jgi:hypothetical protein